MTRVFSFASTFRANAARRLALASALGCTILAGCQADPGPSPVLAHLDPAERTALEHEIRVAVRKELRAELREELATELRKERSAAIDAALATALGERGDKREGPPRKPETDPSIVDVADSEATPGTTISTVDGPIRLVELAVGTDVVDRSPENIREHYDEVPDMLCCYSAIESREPDQSVVHVWRRDGLLVSRVELEVGKSPRWKTWSKQKPLGHWTGNWSCEVVTADGAQLGITHFTIGSK